jgi:heparan-alpha-glucosaminide N-acetyltransferase
MGDELKIVEVQPLFTPAQPNGAPAPLPPPAPPRPEPARSEPPPLQTMYTRLESLDAYRGFIMLAMVSAGLGFPQVAKALPDSEVWQFLGYQTDHVAWTGCAFWDLIQPAFMFMVGVAMPYSHAARVKKGQSRLHIAGHTIYRCVLLVLLGVFLTSNWSKQTDWGFANVLCQIGLGYGFVYLLIGRGFFWQFGALAAILVGYTWWFAAYSVPPDFDYAQMGLKGPWPWAADEFFAHWNKRVNAAAAFDDWFLNLFPRPAEFHYNNGGYQTLNFIPSMATMILGLMAGEMLRRIDLLMREKFLRLVFAGIVCGLAGYVLGEYVCPSVKRIWTPTWALYSAGWVFAMLAGFFLIIDWAEYRRWVYPLTVVGMNSIAVYCMAQLLRPWVRDTLQRHIEWNGGDKYFGSKLLGDYAVFAPIANTVSFTLVIWLIALWMYRKKIFIKI